MEWIRIEEIRLPADVLAERSDFAILAGDLMKSPGVWYEISGLDEEMRGLDVNPFSVWSVLRGALNRQDHPQEGRFEAEPEDSEAMTPNSDRAKVRYVVDRPLNSREE